MDPAAKEIGAVNCIVNRQGKLTGYNTDYLGFAQMIEANGFNVKGKRTAVLGTGGASKAVSYALKKLGADVQLVSRSAKPDCITYEQLYADAESYLCLVNVTPVGMYPHMDESAVELEKFTALEGVIDIVANPLRTKLMFEAEMRGIPYLGGFEMLVRQAAAADELFTGKSLDPSLCSACMDHLYQQKRNLVLIGMPTSGKSTLARMLAKRTGKQVVEMDEEIVKKLGTSIKECFASKGEEYFRTIETETAYDLQKKTGVIISCGGGVIKKEATMRALSANGLVIWIQRDLSYLYATDSRPLTGDETYMKHLYEERKGLYQKYSDAVVTNNGRLEDTVEQIMKVSGGEKK
jgi:shikimate dehydrogenase